MKKWMFLVAVIAACVVSADGLNLAPLVYWEEADDGAWDLRVGGPIFQAAATAEGAELMALRPLAIRLQVPKTEETDRLVRREILWPFASSRLRGDQWHAWFGPIVRTNADVTDPGSAYRRWTLPFFFAGRDQEGNNYRGLFPIAGTVRDVAGIDRISFSLFPLSVRTWKGDIHGQHWLFPLYAKIDGPDLHKRRIMPFWGYAERENRWRRWFYLWPFLNFQKSLENPEDGGFMVFPLFGLIHAGEPGDDRYLRRRTFLWPFFSRVIAKDAKLLHAPWPFYQRVSSAKEELTRTSVFPFWGQQERGPAKTKYLAWPFHVRQKDQRADEVVTRTYVLPFYWSFRSEAEDGERAYTRLWPLYSSGHAPDGTRDLRILDLWPQRNVAPVERAYAPFWTLYRDRTVEGTRHRELLWGLWQHRTRADGRSRHALAWVYDVRTDAAGKKERSWLGGIIKKRAKATESSTD